MYTISLIGWGTSLEENLIPGDNDIFDLAKKLDLDVSFIEGFCGDGKYLIIVKETRQEIDSETFAFINTATIFNSLNEETRLDWRSRIIGLLKELGVNHLEQRQGWLLAQYRL